MKGVALFNKGDQGLGIDWARKGFELNPEDGLLAQQVASLLVQAERVDEVPGVWTLYCRTVSDDPGGWAELAGSLAVLEGRLPEACDAMERASMLEPENPNLWLQLALYAQRAEQWERAADAVDRALAIDPEYEFARQLKAQIEAKRPADGADAEGAEEDDK
jgi:tetratricopeptide (TPR) repeat protein